MPLPSARFASRSTMRPMEGACGALCFGVCLLEAPSLEDRVRSSGILGRLHVGHLRPRYHRCPAESGTNHGQYPIPCGINLSAVSSRWGQRLGQKRAVNEDDNLCKTKILEILRFRGFLARREGFEPPAFWSVGCFRGKSEPFRLRFAFFSAIRSADFPLIPSSPARFFRILGQKWVRHSFSRPHFRRGQHCPLCGWPVLIQPAETHG